MEIKVTRKWKGLNTTLSTVTIDGVPPLYALEDTDRGLTAQTPIAGILKVKLAGRTAIPAGRYRVDITYSNRFKRQLPLLMGVPGFAGIRIHPGNTHADTEGCLLPGLKSGQEYGDFMVGDSRAAAQSLQTLIAAVLAKGEEVWCIIERDYRYAGNSIERDRVPASGKLG